MITVGQKIIAPVHLADFGYNTITKEMEGVITNIPDHRRFAVCEFTLPNGTHLVEDYCIRNEELILE